jgi:hypothetical protein
MPMRAVCMHECTFSKFINVDVMGKAIKGADKAKEKTKKKNLYVYLCSQQDL